MRIERLKNGDWLLVTEHTITILSDEDAQKFAKEVIGYPSVTDLESTAWGGVEAILSNGTRAHLAHSDQVGTVARHLAEMDKYKDL